LIVVVIVVVVGIVVVGIVVVVFVVVVLENEKRDILTSYGNGGLPFFSHGY
jgi:hypothetical protein